MFRKLLSLCRTVVAANMPPPVAFNAGNSNGDLSCDENGALWVHAVPGSGGGSGSLANSLSFSSLDAGTGFVGSYEARSDADIGQVALQSVQAHAAVQCYLQLFTHDAPTDGEFAMYEWPCPYPGGVSQEFGYPWGLRMLHAQKGLTFVFSSTPGVLTSGPLGAVQGIFTYASS